MAETVKVEIYSCGIHGGMKNKFIWSIMAWPGARVHSDDNYEGRENTKAAARRWLAKLGLEAEFVE